MMSQGELSLHYARWLSGYHEVNLELAFWIGPTPGVTPEDSLLTRYIDTAHTAQDDYWIILHLHIPIDSDTFN
jgi:chitinase